jgi:hypothetical protein
MSGRLANGAFPACRFCETPFSNAHPKQEYCNPACSKAMVRARGQAHKARKRARLSPEELEARENRRLQMRAVHARLAEERRKDAAQRFFQWLHAQKLMRQRGEI